MQIFVGEYLRGSPYIQNVLLPEKIIPEVKLAEKVLGILRHFHPQETCADVVTG